VNYNTLGRAKSESSDGLTDSLRLSSGTSPSGESLVGLQMAAMPIAIELCDDSVSGDVKVSAA